MVLRGIVRELAFIYSPIHSPYHIEFFSSDSNRMAHLAAVLTAHVWTVYAHRRGIRWAEERVYIDYHYQTITSQANGPEGKI